MDERELEIGCINIYSQIFIDASELGDCIKIFIPVPDSDNATEEK